MDANPEKPCERCAEEEARIKAYFKDPVEIEKHCYKSQARCDRICKEKCIVYERKKNDK